jgi:hypothetical protein
MKTDSLMARLTNMGYAVFHKEVNLLSSGNSCAEFSLVKLDIECPEVYTKLAKARISNSSPRIHVNKLLKQSRQTKRAIPVNNRFVY